MDVPRKSAAKKKKIRQIVTVVLAVIALAAISKVVAGLKPAAPSVELAQLWPDTVKRGPMVRQVRGLGTLVPETPWAIPAMTDGRIEQRLALPGTIVNPDTLLLVMSNPELQQALVDAEWKLKAAEAELNNLRVKLQSDRLTQQSAAATTETDARKARLQADRDAELRRLGLKSDLEAKISIATAEDLANKDTIEKQRLQHWLGSHRRATGRSARHCRAASRHVPAQAEPGARFAGARRCARHPHAGGCGHRPARRSRRNARQGGAAGEAEGRAEDSGNAGEGRDHRAACFGRYAQRHHRRQGVAHRPGGHSTAPLPWT